MSNIRVKFGKHLRSIRERKGISQEGLGEIAGLHRTYISSVERGERNVSLETVEKLATALDVKMASLMPS